MRRALAPETTTQQPVGVPNTLLENLIFEISPNDVINRKALGVFRAIKNLHIVDPHTHYATDQIVEDLAWETPTGVFLGVPGKGFDHYTATVMNGEGVRPELVYGRPDKNAPMPSKEFEKERFMAMVGALEDAKPNPSSLWFEIALQEAFGINLPATRANAEILWDAISAKLKQPEFRPQELLSGSGIVAALTTDAPEDTLSLHKKHAANRAGPALIPTWRPDSALMIEGSKRVNFNEWIDKLAQASGMEINCLEDFQNALISRMKHFAAHGCVAADIGLANFPSADCSEEQAGTIFMKRFEKALSPDEVQQWKGYMLKWLCVENARLGWVQYFHQGPARDLNPDTWERHGADAGGDGPGETINRTAFSSLLSYLQAKQVKDSVDGTGLARTVVFTINAADYDYVLDTAARFNGNSAGIKSKIQMGPPWWFNDTVARNAEVIRMVADRGSLNNWIGMLSDARCLPSVIARIRQFRALLAVELVKMFPDLDENAIVKKAERICTSNVIEFLGLKGLQQK